MEQNKYYEKYLNEDYRHYVVEYRGNFEEQINKLDYACGSIITNTLGVVAVKESDINRLRKDVASIIFIEFRSIYVLQDISPSDTDNIHSVKVNPYLNLTGKGVVVGIIDTGINYLNEEFIREDGASRILSIWDQTIQSEKQNYFRFGSIYYNNDISKAIEVHKNGGDPYEIVPSKDEMDHGTRMAGIIGARGYNGRMQGVANDCDFMVVKLLQSPNYKKILKENNLPSVPVYNAAEIIAAIEYLRESAKKLKKPLVVFLGLGSHDGSHDGYNMTSRFISSLASREGIAFVAGTGNSGDADGHVVNFIKSVAEVSTVELRVSTAMKKLDFFIWIQKPDRMALNIIDPSGEESGFFLPKIFSVENQDFLIVNTNLKITCYDPENFTGHQVFLMDFTDIKSGIWKIQLRGEYVTRGRYDIWLPDKTLLPEGTKFLSPSPFNTLTIPSTARKITTVAYYNGINNTLLSASGKGFNANGLINPDIAADGVNVLTTTGTDNNIISVSGSCVATAIVAGATCLLVQWQVVDRKNNTLYSTNIRSLLIYSAKREKQFTYPNEYIGYGKLDLLKVFYVLGGGYRGEENYSEYKIGNLFIRCPISMIKWEE